MSQLATDLQMLRLAACSHCRLADFPTCRCSKKKRFRLAALPQTCSVSIAGLAPDSRDDAQKRRSSSARPRKTSKRFANIMHWQCEIYRVTAQWALTGKIIGTWETNDLNAVDVVRRFVSTAIDVSSDRVALAYREDAVGLRDNRSLYACVGFNREPVFQVAITTPRRCEYCRYISASGYELRGRFDCIEGYDYRYIGNNLTETEEKEECEPMSERERLQISDCLKERNMVPLEINPNSQRKQSNRALEQVREQCGCNWSARELGYRDLRFWKRIARCLRQKMRCQAIEHGEGYE